VFVLGYRAALADVLAAHADASAVSITGWSPLAKGVVAALAENGPMEPAQLAEEFGAAPAAVSRALAKLLRQRLVRRTTVGVGGDHRRKPVQLTARGRTLLHDREASAPPPESETGHE
jgi:DNA-binding MarR family transcriptional regulator